MRTSKSLRKQWLQLVLCTVASLTTAAGCKGEIEGGTSLRVLHLSPDAPTIDAFLGEALVVDGLAFTQGTTNLGAEAGQADISVSAAGAGLESAVASLTNQRIEEGKSYTAFAFGELASVQLSLVEDSTQGLASSQVRVRVIHTASGVGNVNVYVEPDVGAPQAIVEDLRYGNAASPVDVAPEPFTAGIDVDDDGKSDLIYEIPALEPGTVVNVFATKGLDGNVSLIAQLPGDATASIASDLPTPDLQRLRVVHLSPDAPPVEPLLDGTSRSEFGQIAFPSSSSYASLIANEAELDVTVDGTLNTSVLNAALAFEPGASYTAVAINRVSSIGALFFRDDKRGLAAGDIRVRAIHGAPDVGQVDVLAVAADGTTSPLVSNVDTGTAAEPFDLPAGAYTVGVDLNNDAKPELYFELPELAAGTLANLYVTQEDSGKVFALAQLDGDVTARIDASESRIRVLHMSRNAPNVDVFVNGGRAITNLPFKSQSGTLTVASGSYDTAVTATGAAIHTAVINANITLLPSKAYTVVAFGDLANISALVLEDEPGGLAATDIRLPITHVAPEVTRGDIYELLNGTAFGAQLVDDFGFGETQTPPDVPAGTYVVGFDANATGVVDVTFNLPLLTPGTFARAYVIQEQNDAVKILVQLEDTIIVVPGN
jgi:hypothetical protein